MSFRGHNRYLTPRAGAPPRHQAFSRHEQGYLALQVYIISICILEQTSAGYVQFSAAYHVCEPQYERVAACTHKPPRLLKYSPHSLLLVCRCRFPPIRALGLIVGGGVARDIGTRVRDGGSSVRRDFILELVHVFGREQVVCVRKRAHVAHTRGSNLVEPFHGIVAIKSNNSVEGARGFTLKPVGARGTCIVHMPVRSVVFEGMLDSLVDNAKDGKIHIKCVTEK